MTEEGQCQSVGAKLAFGEWFVAKLRLAEDRGLPAHTRARAEAACKASDRTVSAA